MPNGKIGGFIVGKDRFLRLLESLGDEDAVCESMLRPWVSGKFYASNRLTAGEIRKLISSDTDPYVPVEIHYKGPGGKAYSSAAEDYSYVLAIPGEMMAVIQTDPIFAGLSELRELWHGARRPESGPVVFE